jgi:hypothetical protein
MTSTSENTPEHGDRFSLFLHQVCDVFPRKEVEAVLNQPKWEDRYPEVIKVWRSPDKQKSGSVYLPSEIVLAIARECTPMRDFYADADGQTLHMVRSGGRPWRYVGNPPHHSIEEITDAKKISVEQALVDYGVDAVWLANEHGKSQKGARDERYRITLRRGQTV